MMIHPSLRGLLVSVLSGLVMAYPAFASDITGEVTDAQGNPVAGVQIAVFDSSGKEAGQATTDDAGRYCITGLDPGTYKDSATPPAGTGLKVGVTTANLPADGLTANWGLYPNAAGFSSANSPGVCAAALLGGPLWWAGGALLVGGTIAACGLLCFGNADHPPPVSASK